VDNDKQEDDDEQEDNNQQEDDGKQETTIDMRYKQNSTVTKGKTTTLRRKLKTGGDL